MTELPAPPSERVSDTLRLSLREIVRECGLKQAFIADRVGVTEKHLSQLLLGRVTLTVDWVQRIVDVCRQPLRLDFTPAEWVADVVTWRERAEAAEAKIAAYEVVHGHADNEETRDGQ
jgi:plasmid maintenance system antidote protein VapI